jgi:uncharacterized protein with ParB-like and HNH nuclease domain
MKIKFENVDISNVIKIWERIDPKPQYQRTPVWKVDRKKLLIDSIFRGYDLPKFYLQTLTNNAFFDYEVCDGQQRLRTIIEFINNEFPLGTDLQYQSKIISKLYFKELDQETKEYFLNYNLTFSTIIESTHEEIRDLFARLQKGMGLNQAELRRALSTNIGIYVESIVNNHKFFKTCGIPNIRNKHQDYIDHVIAYIVNKFSKDFKGQFLKDVYMTISPEIAGELVRKTSLVLDQMEKINNISPGILKNKWGFVDTFILLYQKLEEDLNFPPKLFALEFLKFEKDRKANSRAPHRLIEKSDSNDSDKRLYAYISSFQKDGALKKNMEIRNGIFNDQFNYLFK